MIVLALLVKTLCQPGRWLIRSWKLSYQIKNYYMLSTALIESLDLRVSKALVNILYCMQNDGFASSVC